LKKKGDETISQNILLVQFDFNLCESNP